MKKLNIDRNGFVRTPNNKLMSCPKQHADTWSCRDSCMYFDTQRAQPIYDKDEVPAAILCKGYRVAELVKDERE